MKTPQNSPENARAFTLLEVLISVTVIAIFAGAAVVLINGSFRSASEKKLAQDVVTINAAISTFLANGGDLDGATTAAQVLARLKTRVDDSQADQLVGIRAGFLDPRITAVGQTAGEGASSAARVLWDATKKRFVVKHSGAVGIRQFVLDESKAGAEDPEYTRELVVEYSKKGDDKWVWEYAEHNTSNSGPSNLPPLGTPVVAGTTGTSSALALDPPIVSIPGDDYPLIDYDGLEVTLTDPNPPGVSELFYSVVSGIWERYIDPIAIDPGVNLETQAVTIDPDRWSNSETTLDEYRTTPVKLDLNIAFSNQVFDYISLGGALESGGYPEPTLVEPGTVSLNNVASIPSQFLNSGVFNIYWTVDGTDPRSAPGTFAGDPFADGYPGQEIPVSLDEWGSGDTMQVKVYGRSHNSEIVTDSELVTEILTATKISLPPAIINLVQNNAFPPGYSVTLSLQKDTGKIPLGARIFYTTDGTDPAIDANGEPVTGTLYTGGFQLPTGVTAVAARVFPPGLYSQWFFPSEPLSETVPPLPIADVYVGGEFSAGGGMRNVARLAPDGSIDSGFNPGAGAAAGSVVGTLLSQGSAGVLAGGNFESMSGVGRAAIARLNFDGSLDTSFDADLN